MHLLNHAHLASDQLSSLEQAISHHQSLNDVLQWGLSEGMCQLPHIVAEVIGQDEYTHDVIIPLKNGLVLVYGST